MDTKTKILIAFIVAVGIIVSIGLKNVSATSTQQYNNLKLTPYYFSTLSANTNQTMWVNLNPPDRISSVISALFHFKVFTGGFTTNYALYVNNKLCGNYLVDTSFANSGQYEIAFDCTSLMQTSGNYTIKLKSDRNAGSFYGWLDFTFTSNPPPSVGSIGGTEYKSSEPAKVVLSVLDNSGNPINNGNCFTTVRDSNDVIIVDNQSLNYISVSNGIYFYQFTTTLPIGVYSADSYCILNGVKVYSSDTFHISQWAEDIGNIYSSTQQGAITFGGTEYNGGDPATIWLQLLRNYQPLDNATCYLTVYYPDKSVFLNNTIMQHLAGSDGIYYYDLTAPTVNGVYVSSATCLNPYNAFSDDFSNYNNLESWGNVTIENGKIKLSNAPTGLSNLTANMTGNVLLYHLDELSGMIIDYSGNGNNGTDYEASYGVAGKINTALWFNGVNSVVSIVESNSWKLTDAITVEAWVKFDEIKDNVGTIVGGYASSNGYFLAVNPYANTVYFYLNGVYYYYVVYGQGFSTNTWYHIAGTYDRYGGANNHKIYVNGQIIAQRTSSGAIGNYNLLRIGSGYSVYKFGEGTIDEVAIFNRSLSTSEILNNYNMGVGVPTTNGYIQSKPINLEGVSWNNFNSIYDNKQGNTQFKVLDSSDNVLCSSLGSISICADSISVIKLFANLTRPSVNNTTPEIDNWWVDWIGATIEELRGSGEMHISNASGGGCSVDLTNITNAITSVNDTQNINFADLNINMENNFTNTNNLIAGITSTINSWGNNLNSTMTSWGNSITSTINYWGNALENKIDSIIMGNVTVTALVDYDEIATTVVQYFKSLGFKFPLLG